MLITWEKRFLKTYPASKVTTPVEYVVVCVLLIKSIVKILLITRHVWRFRIIISYFLAKSHLDTAHKVYIFHLSVIFDKILYRNHSLRLPISEIPINSWCWCLSGCAKSIDDSFFWNHFFGKLALFDLVLIPEKVSYGMISAYPTFLMR